MTEQTASAERCASTMRNFINELRAAVLAERTAKAGFDDVINKTLSLHDMLELLTFDSIYEKIWRYRQRTPGRHWPERISVSERQYIEMERMRSPYYGYSVRVDRGWFMGIKVCICESG